MSAEKNKTIARRFFEDGFNKGRLAVADEFISPQFVNHDPAMPGLPVGIEGFRKLVTTYCAAFPDIYTTIEDMIAEGNRVAVHWRAHGRQTGTLMGIPPTGKQATVTGISIFRLTGDLIVEAWTNWDTLGLLQQLGVVPAMAQVMQ